MEQKEPKWTGIKWSHDRWCWSLSVCSVLSEASLWFCCNFGKQPWNSHYHPLACHSEVIAHLQRYVMHKEDSVLKSSIIWSALLSTSSRFCLRDRYVVECWTGGNWLGILALSVVNWLILDKLPIFLKLTFFIFKMKTLEITTRFMWG